jgi:alcohol dehydrogenase
MLEPSYPKILDGDREALAAMALGAHLAGAAIEQSMLGAAHAMANPLTAELGVPHAAAVGLALPHVVRWNASSVGALYDQLTGGSDGGMGLSLWLEEVRRRAGLPERLREVGAEPDHLPKLAAAATREWTGEHNPRRLSEADFLALYEAAL